MKKYKLYTHNDLDAVASFILAKIIFLDNIDVEYCDYNNIDEKTMAITIADLAKYEKIFFVDISMQFRTANMIDTILKMTKLTDKIVLLDHHKTALELNCFDWATVKVEENGELVCGARLFFNYLNNSFGIDEEEISPFMLNFIEAVNRYDTWLWKTKYNDDLPRQLNQLCYLVGRDKFIQDILYKFDNSKPLLSDDDLELLRAEDLKIEKYIDTKEKSLLTGCLDKYKIGLVLAEQYISQLGNVLAERHPELDIIAVFRDNKVSFRSVKDDVDCSTFAKLHYNGGGHKSASGSSLTWEQLYEMIATLSKNCIEER